MKKNIEWSNYQMAVFDDIKNGTGNTIILARAGASKTTVLVEGTKYIPAKKKVIFVAFNKKIATELDARINKSYIEVRTLHSKGFATIKKAFGNISLDPDKAKNLAEQILFEKGFKKFEKEKFGLMISLQRVVNLCKGAMIDTPSKIDILLDEFGVDMFDMEREEFIQCVCQVLRKCKENKLVIDYSDMIWYPFVFNLNTEKYDIVFIDEGQDLNKCQIHLALSLCKPGGRIIIAADDRQVLYSFTGVEINTIEKLTIQLKAKILPLPISYRCATNIVKLAQEIVPDIQSAPGAKEGEVKYIKEKDLVSLAKPGCFILSRVNAPLIRYCLALLKNGVPANIAGRDIGANLSWMIRKSEAKTIPQFIQWLDEWKRSELARLKVKNRDPILILDKYACLENLCEDARSVDGVLDNIKELFTDGDDSNRVILSSTHKAKGLERDIVYMLNWTYRRDYSQEESNVIYVAQTRAKTQLNIVEK